MAMEAAMPAISHRLPAAGKGVLPGFFLRSLFVWRVVLDMLPPQMMQPARLCSSGKSHCGAPRRPNHYDLFWIDVAHPGPLPLGGGEGEQAPARATIVPSGIHHFLEWTRM